MLFPYLGRTFLFRWTKVIRSLAERKITQQFGVFFGGAFIPLSTVREMWSGLSATKSSGLGHGSTLAHLCLPNSSPPPTCEWALPYPLFKLLDLLLPAGKREEFRDVLLKEMQWLWTQDRQLDMKNEKEKQDMKEKRKDRKILPTWGMRKAGPTAAEGDVWAAAHPHGHQGAVPSLYPSSCICYNTSFSTITGAHRFPSPHCVLQTEQLLGRLGRLWTTPWTLEMDTCSLFIVVHSRRNSSSVHPPSMRLSWLGPLFLFTICTALLTFWDVCSDFQHTIVIYIFCY